MVRISNGLVGALNILTLLFSIPILIIAAWLYHKATTECEKFLQEPLIILGVLLLVVSLAGILGACCRMTWLLWIYLAVMFILIVFMFCFTIAAVVVMHEGTGKVLSGKGYKESRLEDYSHWLQKYVNNNEHWNTIKSCLAVAAVCKSTAQEYANSTLDNFYKDHLSAVQSGCCKPSDDCKFIYVSPTQWSKPTTPSTFSNLDCNAWDNDENTKCYNCQSCKAGFIDNLKKDWKKVAIVNIALMIIFIIIYSTGCCAIRNNRRDNTYRGRYKGYP